MTTPPPRVRAGLDRLLAHLGEHIDHPFDETPDEIAIPRGHYSEGQARLIAGALTGDTDMIRRRLDEIATDDQVDDTPDDVAAEAMGSALSGYDLAAEDQADEIAFDMDVDDQ